MCIASHDLARVAPAPCDAGSLAPRRSSASPSERPDLGIDFVHLRDDEQRPMDVILVAYFPRQLLAKSAFAFEQAEEWIISHGIGSPKAEHRAYCPQTR